MQLHFSPSMRSITISSSNGFIDLMKIKVAARHISYRTVFHTILILAFLLPFVFILTAVVTLEGVNKCSSFGTLFIYFFNSPIAISIPNFYFLVFFVCIGLFMILMDGSWLAHFIFIVIVGLLGWTRLIGFVNWVPLIHIEI